MCSVKAALKSASGRQFATNSVDLRVEPPSRTPIDKLDRRHSSRRRERLGSPNIAGDDYQIESLSPTPPPRRRASNMDPITSPVREPQPDTPRTQLDPRPLLHQPSRNYQQGPFMVSLFPTVVSRCLLTIARAMCTSLHLRPHRNSSSRMTATTSHLQSSQIKTRPGTILVRTTLR